MMPLSLHKIFRIAEFSFPQLRGPGLHSTVTCLFKNTDDWYTGLGSGQMLGMVFVDLKRAFDTVDQRILCENLSCMGFKKGNSPGSKVTSLTDQNTAA